MAQTRFVENQRDLADALGVNRARIKWWRGKGCPCGVEDKIDGKLDVLAIRGWLVERGIPVGTGDTRAPPVTAEGGNGAGSRYVESRAETQGHKARLAELEVQRLEGQLLDRAEQEAHDRERLEYLRDTIAQWAVALGPALAGKTIVQVNRELKKRIEGLFREFAGENIR